MNRVVLMGRLTKDPDIRYTQGQNAMAIARYTIAVDRRRSRNSQSQDQQTADFISCKAFGKSAEFAEKYLHKGIKICVEGRIETGSYTNKDGVKVYTTEVVIDNQEFAESKNSQSVGQEATPAQQNQPHQVAGAPEGFMNSSEIDEDLPFA